MLDYFDPFSQKVHFGHLCIFTLVLLFLKDNHLFDPLTMKLNKLETEWTNKMVTF